MKSGLFYMVMIFCLVSNIYGYEKLDKNFRLSVNQENLRNDLTSLNRTASSIGIFADSNNLLYGGISLNHITSSDIIQHSNRKTIYPFYLVFGLKLPSRISPYVELGTDFGEIVFDEIFRNKRDTVNETDYYFSAGVNFVIGNVLSFSIYAKQYNFYFRDTYLDPIRKVNLSTYGAGVAIHF